MGLAVSERLSAYESWWETEGFPISLEIDRMGTPHLRQYNEKGQRIDEILYPPAYQYLLAAGYAAGVISEVALRHDLRFSYQLGFIASYYDPGLYCPYTVTLSTWVPLYKYFSGPRRDAILNALGRTEPPFWQGATWMTEIGSGSDLGSHVHTTASQVEGQWRLVGEKYFSSNVGADIAVVAARPDKAPPGPKGLALYAVPRKRQDGTLNYLVRRLKDKIGTRSVPTGEVELRQAEAYLIGEAAHGIYYILEVLNFSRIANAVGVVAHGLHALRKAYEFAQQRIVFGKPLAEQPLFQKELAEHYDRLRYAGALAWLAEQWLETAWLEKPPYSQRYAIFRLLSHLAKFWTAEVALQAARWAIEIWGGLGILAEFPVERFLRELLITSIWEGTRHRHLIDGWEIFAKAQLLSPLNSLWHIESEAPGITAHLEKLRQAPEADLIQHLEATFARLAEALGRVTIQEKAFRVLSA
jgi:alkylation response protein AidB-like acyl-CoA dehydrogenase